MKNRPLSEITLRKYEKPFNLEGRELIKKLCLSLGLLQPGDGRDVVVDVFCAIYLSKEPLGAAHIEKFVKTHRKQHNLEQKGITPANIRRQIKKLRDIHLIQKTGQAYNLSENMTLPEVFEDKIEKIYLSTLIERVKEYCHAAQRWKDGTMPKMQQ